MGMTEHVSQSVDDWAKVELYRWQHGEFPVRCGGRMVDDVPRLDYYTAAYALAKAMREGDPPVNLSMVSGILEHLANRMADFYSDAERYLEQLRVADRTASRDRETIKGLEKLLAEYRKASGDEMAARPPRSPSSKKHDKALGRLKGVEFHVDEALKNMED